MCHQVRDTVIPCDMDCVMLNDTKYATLRVCHHEERICKHRWVIWCDNRCGPWGSAV